MDIKEKINHIKILSKEISQDTDYKNWYLQQAKKEGLVEGISHLISDKEDFSLKEDLKTKVEQIKQSFNEIAHDEEYRNWFSMEAKRRSLTAEKDERGTCFNGCAPCLPCLITPTPDFEIAIGFGIFEFH